MVGDGVSVATAVSVGINVDVAVGSSRTKVTTSGVDTGSTLVWHALMLTMQSRKNANRTDCFTGVASITVLE